MQYTRRGAVRLASDAVSNATWRPYAVLQADYELNPYRRRGGEERVPTPQASLVNARIASCQAHDKAFVSPQCQNLANMAMMPCIAVVLPACHVISRKVPVFIAEYCQHDRHICMQARCLSIAECCLRGRYCTCMTARCLSSLQSAARMPDNIVCMRAQCLPTMPNSDTDDVESANLLTAACTADVTPRRKQNPHCAPIDNSHITNASLCRMTGYDGHHWAQPVCRAISWQMH